MTGGKGGGLPPELQAELEALEERKRKGEVTAFEFAAKRKDIEKRAAGKGFAAAAVKPEEKKPDETPAGGGTGAAAADAGKKEEQPAEPKVKMPGAWSKSGGDRRSGPKTWSDGKRTDDPTKRVVHEPLGEGIGGGRAFFFLFGFKIHSDRDQEFLAKETNEIQDDVEALRKAGYRVVFDPQATRQDFIDAVTGSGEGAVGLVPAGVYWSAHGNADGSVETCDGGLLTPADLDPAKVSPGLRLMVFASCYVGSRSRRWREIGRAHV
jgi:hypothetical protein